jgi:hypothetical protein
VANPDKTPLRIHVLPLDDLIEHEQSEDCVCGPDVELVSAVNDGWLISHHSLDGREAWEE